MPKPKKDPPRIPIPQLVQRMLPPYLRQTDWDAPPPIVERLLLPAEVAAWKVLRRHKRLLDRHRKEPRAKWKRWEKSMKQRQPSDTGPGKDNPDTT